MTRLEKVNGKEIFLSSPYLADVIVLAQHADGEINISKSLCNAWRKN